MFSSGYAQMLARRSAGFASGDAPQLARRSAGSASGDTSQLDASSQLDVGAPQPGMSHSNISKIVTEVLEFGRIPVRKKNPRTEEEREENILAIRLSKKKKSLTDLEKLELAALTEADPEELQQLASGDTPQFARRSAGSASGDAPQLARRSAGSASGNVVVEVASEEEPNDDFVPDWD